MCPKNHYFSLSIGQNGTNLLLTQDTSSQNGTCGGFLNSFISLVSVVSSLFPITGIEFHLLSFTCLKSLGTFRDSHNILSERNLVYSPIIRGTFAIAVLNLIKFLCDFNIIFPEPT